MDDQNKIPKNLEIPDDLVTIPARTYEKVQIEFVNIKIEPDLLNESIKEEPCEDNKCQPIWRPPDTIFTTSLKIEPIDIGKQTKKEFKIEVEIKEEPQVLKEYDIDYETKYDKADDLLPDAPQFDCLGTLISSNHLCKVCNKRFASKGNLKRHKIFHTKKKFECNDCFRQFLKKDQLLKHIDFHKKEKRYKCSQCNKMFKTSSNLEQHKRVHLDMKPYQCEKCLKRFAIRPYLVKHQSNGHCKRPNDEPLICNVCNKIFEKEILLRSHLRRHTTEKPYTCQTCNMNFKYKSTVIRHVQLHNDIKPFKCKYCPKTFTHAGLLKPHLRVHTGERPFQCPMCEKCFTHKHNMSRHVERHKKVKNLVCGICNKKFPKESRLVYHMKVHTNERPFPCEICPKRFAQRQNVIRHYSRKHPNDTYKSKVTDASVAKNIAKVMIQLPSIPNIESDRESILP